MIQKYPKRLIEVDLPIKRISAHARREKSIRHGHISTLHIWWARRPLAACRAVICASLWPDPADPLCPQDFRDKASKIVFDFATAAASSKELGGSCDPETWIKWQALAKTEGLDSHKEAHWNILRFALLDFIADFANWDNSTVKEYLDTSRALTQAAHEALGGEPGTRPLVVDPFAGGGSIPLEALRVGADAFASDLNPVSVLLNKVVLEYIPKFGQHLADGVRKWGEWIKQESEKELAEFYPKRRVFPRELQRKPVLLITASKSGLGYVTTMDAQKLIDERGEPYTHYVPISPEQVHGPTALQASLGSFSLILGGPERRLKELKAEPIHFIEETPIAFLWARTIRCEGPGCGAEVPLMRSLWLAKKGSRSVALQLLPSQNARNVEVRIAVKKRDAWVDQSNQEFKIDKPIFTGTVSRGSATCPCCGYTTPVSRVREQMKAERGGANNARLMCVVSTRSDEKGRFYRLPCDVDLRAFRSAEEALLKNAKAHIGDISFLPDERLDVRGIRHTWGMIYGQETWTDHFNRRQLLALTTFTRLVHSISGQADGDTGLHTAIATCLALNLSKLADLANSLCPWEPVAECPRHLFSRQAIPFTWDYGEGVPIGDSSGSWQIIIDRFATILAGIGSDWIQSTPHISSATAHPLPDGSATTFITDPPYYDAVPYAYLSDFFYVWLRRSLFSLHPELLIGQTVPKDAEIVVDRMHELSNSTHDVAFYERELTMAFAEGRRVLRPKGIGTIVFASKTTASWEAILKAVVDAGWTITGSWPIDTEMETRVSAQGQARLASSVHLVCRPREGFDGASGPGEVGDWRDVLQELPRRIHEWMPRLASEGVVGADAIFACLGPALEVFSRYSRVEKASGEPVALKEYLEHVWAAVAKEALAQVFKGADATGFEPDARLTAMWLWTLNAPVAGSKAEDSEEEDGEDEEQETKKPKMSGFKLEYDAARKIAQGLGAVLENLTHLVEVKGDEARLLPVAERTRHLFGKEEEEPAHAARKKASAQMNMFAELTGSDDTEVAWQEKTVKRVGETTLDRVHQAMILFAAGRGEALKRFVVDDGVGQDGKFWRLADALNALYPAGSEERRWVEGVLARKKSFGF